MHPDSSTSDPPSKAPHTHPPGGQATRPPGENSADVTVVPTAIPLIGGALAIPERFGRYKILRRLGEGGMGVVFLAEDALLSRPVALKIPFIAGPEADEIRARFLREARAAAFLNHPNICPIHDLGEINGVPFLTMAFLNGSPLSLRLREGPLPVAEAVHITLKLAHALQAAHEHGVIHRDIKPANVMIDERQEPVLMDFGLARRQDLAGGSHLTQQGQILGTPNYMPPEQLDGNPALMGPGCDVYSLGMVLYEMLAGQLPFQGTVLAIMQQIGSATPRPPSAFNVAIDAWLDGLCLKALAKTPAERWSSMREFAAALEDYQRAALANAATIASPPVPLRAPSPAPARPILSLRVEGTPFVYRPRSDQDVITVGRQKRGPTDPPDHGNDFVLRVAGNDALSARISRRHFELRRQGEHWAVVDVSKAGLHVNSQPVPRQTPTPIQAGDRLMVAGVVTLEVLLQHELGGVVTIGVQVATPTRAATPVEMEASMGDMLTLD